MLKTFRSLGMLLFFVFVGVALEEIGDALTTEQAFSWYTTLQKPEWLWSLSSMSFALTWTIAYFVLAVSGWLVWLGKKPGYQTALIFWAIQLLLFACWIPLFFGQQEIFYSLILMDTLGIFVLITMILFFRYSKLASFLMFLFLGWVSYAGILNFMIWQMNT